MNNFRPEQAAEAGAELEAANLQDDNEQLRAEIAQLKADLQREHDLYLRNAADFENYRRRVERERAQMAQAGKRELLLPLLEVLDDFDRALQHADDETQPPASLVVGLRAIQRRLVSVLAAQGVTTFESRGQQFDPLRHEALGVVESDTAEPGVIVDEVQRGWRWGDELLRPARVRVAQ